MIRSLLCFLLLPPLIVHAQSPLIDPGFQTQFQDAVVNKVLVLPDGKILVGGAFWDYEGTQLDGLVRLLPDGSLDPDWNTGGTGVNGAVEDLCLDAQGRIMIGGTLLAYNNVPCTHVIRLHPNGTRDFTYISPWEAMNAAVHAVEMQGDKVIAAGSFQNCFDQSQPYIARFGPDGSLDTTFNIGSGFWAPVIDVEVLADQRIMCGGSFLWFDQYFTGKLALLQAGGPLDNTMDVDTAITGGYDEVKAIELQPDGKILVGGSFTHHNAQPANGLIRLNIDGTRDPSFTSPFYPYAIVHDIASLPDGKILVSGEFTGSMYGIGETGPANFVKLNSDGSRDTSFPIAEGFGPGNFDTHFVRDIEVQPDGKILLGGLFGSFDGDGTHHHLIRLDPSVPTRVEQNVDRNELQLFATPDRIFIHFPVNGDAIIEILSATGQLVATSSVGMEGAASIAHDLRTGIYIVQVRQGDRRWTGRVVVP